MPTPASVSLRPLTGADADFLWHWIHGTPQAQWHRWDGPYFDHGQPIARDEYVAQFVDGLPRENQRLIVVADEPIGMVSRYEEDPVGGGWWELGIVIYDPAWWGQGLGGQALALWAQETFAQTNAHVLTLTTWGGNERMVRCAQRVGFTECARIPQARLWDGRRWDSVKLARLRDGN